MKQGIGKQGQDFGTFRISADGRVFLYDLALLTAVQEEMRVQSKIASESTHTVAMTYFEPQSASTLAAIS